MKIILFALCLFFSFQISAQVTCIRCFHQNDSISYFVNNLLLNGGFESTTCQGQGYFCPQSSNYVCDIDNWTCTGGGSGTYAQYYYSNWTIIVEGTKAAYLGSSFCRSCNTIQGDTSCIIREDCSVSGFPPGYPTHTQYYGGSTGVSLEQTINGLTSGNAYVLEFWTGGEWGFLKPGIFGLDIGFGQMYLTCNPTPTNSIGDRYLIEFNADSSSHTIKFTNWGHICSSCTEVLLDDIRVYRPYEMPSTFPSCPTMIYSQDEYYNISVYPNPVVNNLIIDSGSTMDGSVIIFDVCGRAILESEINGKTVIPLDKIDGGGYVYSIRTAKGEIKKGQFIKL